LAGEAVRSGEISAGEKITLIHFRIAQEIVGIVDDDQAGAARGSTTGERNRCLVIIAKIG